MLSPGTLTRPEFNRACLGFLEAGTREIEDVDERYTRARKGWRWAEHKSVPGWGHLIRTAFSRTYNKTALEDTDTEALDDEELVEPQDESSASAVESSIDGLYLHESIIWHPTYMVPAYYFQAVDSSGSPATLAQVITTDRFKRRTLLDSSLDITDSVVQPKETGNAQFPLLSSGDHPILGTPHWYFHPCETSPAVKEILDQSPEADWDPNNIECLVRWLNAWFAVLSTAVDMS